MSTNISLDVRITHILQEENGKATGKDWRKIAFVGSTEADKYPKSVCFQAWGDKVDEVKNLQIGQQLKVYFNPESREYNGKWYTDLKIWRLDTTNAGGSSPADYNTVQADAPEDFGSFKSDVEGDDLPF